MVIIWGFVGLAVLFLIDGREMLVKYVGRDSVSSNSPPQVASKPTSQSSGRELVFRADQRGHFMLKAYVNSGPIDFMVDTGATMVVLNMEDARGWSSAKIVGFQHTRADG